MSERLKPEELLVISQVSFSLGMVKVADMVAGFELDEKNHCELEV